MRAAGWIVSGVGTLVGLAVIAYAFMWADFQDSHQSSAGGDHVRMVLVGIGIAAVALAIGGGLRHGRRWASYVFVGLAAVFGIAAVWWAVTEIIG
ncbi:hypothetical protein [uncultured Demequina sp.]|uniref:hypothetical protein n=1 Tax=uncultured Demequina sp. TaxID=693499 RepID=UPI0025E93CA9|nr:hypothetical protein [uncultured Demequina sp.]